MAAPAFNLNHSKIHTQPLRFTWICKGQIKGSLLKGKKNKTRTGEGDRYPARTVTQYGLSLPLRACVSFSPHRGVETAPGSHPPRSRKRPPWCTGVTLIGLVWVLWPEEWRLLPKEGGQDAGLTENTIASQNKERVHVED